MLDRNTILFFLFLAAVALSAWLWFQVPYQAEETAKVWLGVHQAEIKHPDWYKRPDFRDYVKPPIFHGFDLVPDSVPYFFASPADRKAQFRVRLRTERGEEVWVMRLEDKGTFLLTDWRPVLFMPEESLRRLARRAA